MIVDSPVASDSFSEQRRLHMAESEHRPSFAIDANSKAGDLLSRVSTAIHERLRQLRDSLLTLHKALVDSERVSYEKTVGAIQSPNHFFQLLTNDPWFAWLQPLSHLVVTMDEALDANKKKPLTETEAEVLIKEAGRLLVPSEEGDGFPHHYYDALQRDPDVVMAHADAAKLFHPRKPPTG